MKLAAKITLCLVALVGVVFAVGGFIMVDSNFSRGLESIEAHSLTGHLNAKETLRSHLAGAMYGETPTPDYTLAGWGKQMAAALAANNGMCAVLNEGYTAYHNNLPREFGKSVQASILAHSRYTRLFYRFSGRTYLVFPDKVSMGGARYGFISAFDITPLFEERQAQTHTFYTVYTVVLACAALLAAAGALLVTGALRKLEKTANNIAAGDYSQRTGLAGEDEIGRLAASFDAMAQSVEEKMAQLILSAQQREDFMSAFTHELKTPMTAMMGYAALLKKGALNGDEKDKALGYIHSETRRLENLSQKLLMLMGLSEGSVQLGPVPLDAVLRKVQDAFPQEGLRLVLPFGTDADVHADIDLLADLLVNLVRNGFQAQPENGAVHIETAAAGDTLTLLIHDFGKGIPKEALARLTEPFYRPEPSRHAGGSGLGLALCGRIAQLHGTELQFESRPGEGTTVRFTLRRAGGLEVDENGKI